MALHGADGLPILGVGRALEVEVGVVQLGGGGPAEVGLVGGFLGGEGGELDGEGGNRILKKRCRRRWPILGSTITTTIPKDFISASTVPSGYDILYNYAS